MDPVEAGKILTQAALEKIKYFYIISNHSTYTVDA